MPELPIDMAGAVCRKAMQQLFATIVIWSTPSLFMYYLNRYYDPWAQNFYRYLVACIAIAPFVIFRIQRGGPRFDWHAVMICFIPCLPNVVHQVTQVMALSYMGPGVYTIFTRASVIFTALLALAFFPEERHVIRQWQFQAGTALGLIGAFGVVWFQPGWEAGHIALPGLFIAFTATFCWALYGILVKRPSAQLGSIRSFGLISLITSAPFASAYVGIWKNWHSASHGSARQFGFDHFRSKLHYPGTHLVLRSHPRDRRRAGANTSTPLSGGCNGALRMDLR